MNVKEIPIGKIKIYQNIRSDKKDVAGLMQSMERDGLQHPIGVYAKDNSYILTYGFRRFQAAKKLNWKSIPAVIIPGEFTEEDFLTKNTVENIHREEVNPVELGRVCQLFTDKKFSVGEIAMKLHIAEDRVKTSLQLWRKLPIEYRDAVGFIPRGSTHKGKIPAAVAMAIVRLKLSTKQMKELLDFAKVHELRTAQIFLLEKLSRTGLSYSVILKNIDNYAVKNINLYVNRKELKKLDISFAEYIKELIRGTEPPNKNLLI